MCVAHVEKEGNLECLLPGKEKNRRGGGGREERGEREKGFERRGVEFSCPRGHN